MLTVAKVEASLRSCLRDPRVFMRFRYLRGDAGHLYFHIDKKRRVIINPFNGGITATVVHELIHSHYEGRLKPWGRKLEEVLVLALEDETMNYINSDTARALWWHREIQKKLPE